MRFMNVLIRRFWLHNSSCFHYNIFKYCFKRMRLRLSKLEISIWIDVINFSAKNFNLPLQNVFPTEFSSSVEEKCWTGRQAEKIFFLNQVIIFFKEKKILKSWKTCWNIIWQQLQSTLNMALILWQGLRILRL